MIHELTDAEADLLVLAVARLERAGSVTTTFRRLDPARQSAIVSAVLAEAAERGVVGTAMKPVAHRAGISVGALYRYFPDRDAMVLAAAAIAGEFLAASLALYGPTLAALPLREGLREYLRGGVEWSRGWGDMLRVFARAAYSGDRRFAEPLVMPVSEAMIGLIRGMLTAARERGELRPGVEVESLTRIVHALLVIVGDSALLPHLTAYTRLGENPDADVDAAVDLVLAAVGANDA